MLGRTSCHGSQLVDTFHSLSPFTTMTKGFETQRCLRNLYQILIFLPFNVLRALYKKFGKYGTVVKQKLTFKK